MFGIGLGELLIVLLVVFLFSPKDLPRVMRRIGSFIGTLEQIRNDLFYIKKEFNNTIKEMESEKQNIDEKIGEVIEQTITVENIEEDKN